MSPVCVQLNKERRYLMAAGALLLILAALYMYCVSATIMHVVVRKETTTSIRELNSQIAQLETEYIAAQHAVSERVATLPGFVATPEKVFITRGDTALVVRDRLLP